MKALNLSLKAILDLINTPSEDSAEQGNLGQGSFGSVVLYRNSRGRTFAKKTALPAESPAEKHKIITYFFKEVFTQIVAAHPCIMPIQGWSVFDQGTPAFCYLMPYCDKGTVARNLASLRPIQKTIIAYGTARAMKHIQTRFNIVHRDLKVSNVFLTDDLHPLLGDLGFAKIPSKIPHSVSSGSMFHMAPELLLDPSNPAPPKSDVYSYGILIATLIEGKPLTFSEDAWRGVANPDTLSLTDIGQILTQGHRPAVTQATAAEQQWLARLWAPEPADRPSFIEICDELEHGEHWFGGTSPSVDDRQLFEAYRSEIEKGERANEAPQVRGSEEEVPAWVQNLQDNPEVHESDFIMRVLSAALDGDLEAQKFASMVYLAGADDFGRSTLLAVRFAVESGDPILGTLAKASSYAEPWHRGQILEATGKLAEAAVEYRAAAQKGDGYALWRLGVLLVRNDLGLHFERGLDMIRRAAEAGIQDAAYELGQLYQEGVMVDVDEEQAIGWFKKALEMGHNDAALTLALIHHRRLDFEKAYVYYDHAAKRFGEAKAIQPIDFLGPLLGWPVYNPDTPALDIPS
jgi:serine/threonine protein kinase